jgi:hypothetical protein
MTMKLYEGTAMSQAFEFTYNPLTQARLTAKEEEILYDYLTQGWPEALKYPLNVNEGYDISYDGGQLTVGRSHLYEYRAKLRLQQEAIEKNKLRGLYFPLATPSINLVCQATLYFDEFYIVHPGSTVLGGVSKYFIYPTGYHDEEAAAIYMRSREEFMERLLLFDEQVFELKRADILHALPPMMQEDDQFVDLITADIDDNEFERIVRKSWNSPAFLAANKMEPLLPLIGDGLDIDAVREDFRNRAGYSKWIPNYKKDIFCSRVNGIKEVDPLLAASILLNHAFLLSEHFGLIPFTDDETSTQLLQCKLRRLSTVSGFENYRKRLNLTSATLAVRVLEEYLPNFHFECVSDALEARSVLHKHLAAFREAMRSFAAEIEESPYDAVFSEKLERIIAAKIRPAVRSLENEIQKSRDSFISKCLKSAQTGALPIAASIFAGLPIAAVLAISAGVLTFSAAIETYQDVRRTKNNGLTLLLGR